MNAVGFINRQRFNSYPDINPIKIKCFGRVNMKGFKKHI